MATSGGIVDFQFRTSLGADPGAAIWSNRAPPGSTQRYGVGVVEEAPNTFLILWNSGGPDDVTTTWASVSFSSRSRGATGTGSV